MQKNLGLSVTQGSFNVAGPKRTVLRLNRAHSSAKMWAVSEMTEPFMQRNTANGEIKPNTVDFVLN